MEKLACARINIQKNAEFCVMQRSNLLFVKDFGLTMDGMRVFPGRQCPDALFSCDNEFVCVRRPLFIWRTYALIIQTHMRPNLTARATQLPSLSLIQTVAL